MNRPAAALALLFTLSAPGLRAQVLQAPGPATSPPATPQTPATPEAAPPAQTFIEREDARETRERLHELLRQHPPAVGEILRRDPSLARADYLAPYPALLAFIQQHPEIVRNPSFFFGEYEYRDQTPRDRSYEMFRTVIDG